MAQLSQLDMKVDLRVDDADMPHGCGQNGQHRVDIPSFFSPESKSTTGVVVTQVVQTR